MSEPLKIYEFIDNLFSPEELMAFENITFNSVDIAELQKTGNVVVITKELENGYTQKTYDYESFDGKVAFTKICSYPKVDSKKIELQRLSELIDTSVKREDYESAAKHAAERNALLGVTK